MKERDRRAILAMAGDFRVSFQFVETAGFVADYLPTAPYFSWGTEHVHVLAEQEDFISLQHTLVMFFETDAGEVHGPMVMKHWRQDWTFEDTELHVFLGNRTWSRERRDAAEVAGQWTQAVYQVDDSPRYEVVGKWQHGEGYSAWQSQTSHRPLPRREFSVRDDYNLLEGEHRITLTPNGWLHEQFNRKVMKPSPFGTTKDYLAQEVGVNRYERITEPRLDAAQAYWHKTQGYWQAVRDTWREVYRDYDTFQLKATFEDRKLFEHHFSHAAEIEASEEYDPDAGRQLAEGVILSFVEAASAQSPEQGEY
ncbi:DUF6607 family protein [Ferrimonas sp. YFM]|uniref:DUF6607 family protein n=1 Tax=Ferrimonas sp. YFM TaxID=3028878 RepID=UPI0025738452|nr:DUF6607 family protein [Ferrimonas sp. YFM]BDY04406.1 hypothetical protein F0521_14470 [Ferrimonas sp. YFM]